MKNCILLTLVLFLACSPAKRMSHDTRAESAIMKEDVYTLASDAYLGRETGTEGEKLAAKYIIKEFKEHGIKYAPGMSSYLQPFPFTANPHFDPSHGHPIGDAIGNNVIGIVDNNSKEYIVIGAHYDHLGMGGPYSREPDIMAIHNGADDNASGVAGLFSVVRQLNKIGIKRNIMIVGFSGEEFGLWGSKHLVNHLPVSSDKISFMVNMDMIGRLNDNNDIVVHGVGTTTIWSDILNEANKVDNLNLVLKESGTGPSDFSPFYKAGMPVLSFFTGQHDDYHKSTDDADKVNYEGMASITSLISQTIALADREKTLTFLKTKEEEVTTSSFKVTLGVMPDYVYQGEGLRIDAVRPNRPAALAGILDGDIVLKMGKYDTKDIYKYMEALEAFEKGQKVLVVVKRDKTNMEFLVEF